MITIPPRGTIFQDGQYKTEPTPEQWVAIISSDRARGIAK